MFLGVIGSKMMEGLELFQTSFGLWAYAESGSWA